MEGTSTAYKSASNRIKSVISWSYFPKMLREYFATDEVHLYSFHWKLVIVFYIHDTSCTSSSTKDGLELKCKSYACFWIALSNPLYIY